MKRKMVGRKILLRVQVLLARKVVGWVLGTGAKFLGQALEKRVDRGKKLVWQDLLRLADLDVLAGRKLDGAKGRNCALVRRIGGRSDGGNYGMAGNCNGVRGSVGRLISLAVSGSGSGSGSGSLGEGIHSALVHHLGKTATGTSRLRRTVGTSLPAIPADGMGIEDVGVVGIAIVPLGHGTRLADVDLAGLAHVDDALLGPPVAVVAFLDLAVHLDPVAVPGEVSGGRRDHRHLVGAGCHGSGGWGKRGSVAADAAPCVRHWGGVVVQGRSGLVVSVSQDLVVNTGP